MTRSMLPAGYRETAPRHCHGCGRVLESDTKTYQCGYDVDTGQKIPDLVVLLLRCPKRLPDGVREVGDPARHDAWYHSPDPGGFWAPE